MKIKRMIKKFLKRDNGDSERIYLETHGFVHGKNYHCYSSCAIDANFPWLISVGDNVMISTNVKLLAHDASTGYVNGGYTKIGRIVVGNNVFIGSGSIVLCNTKIGDNVIIGSNSVVTKDLESNGVYAGNPAKLICTMSEFCRKHEENLKSHPVFTERSWDDWKNASQSEWEEMKNRLEDTFGYVH